MASDHATWIVFVAYVGLRQLGTVDHSLGIAVGRVNTTRPLGITTCGEGLPNLFLRSEA